MPDFRPRMMPAMGNPNFDETSWTLIQAAAAHPSTESRKALASLCQIYWRPVYAFILKRGYESDQAEDLTQGFFALLLEKNFLIQVHRERGKFRSFLLACVTHFLANEWDREQALKRGGGQVTVSIDLVESEQWYAPSATVAANPESLFERTWALAVLERATETLRADYSGRGKSDLFNAIFVYLSGETEAVGWDELADQLQMSCGALRMHAGRMKEKFGKCLRQEILETVNTPDQINDEIRFLMAALSERGNNHD